MTAYRRDDLRTRVQTIVRDTSSTCTTVVNDYLDDVYKYMTAVLKFPELLSSCSHGTGTGSFVDFSVIDSSLTVYNIVSIRDPNGLGRTLLDVSAQAINRAVTNQSSTTGYPEVYWPKNDHALNVWPYGSNTTWEVYYTKGVTDFSADSLSIEIPPEASQVIINGVIAKVFQWKDDDRSTAYQRDFEKGMKMLRQNMYNPFEDNRMRPNQDGNVGDSITWMFRD